ncbi:uncharacterized protein A4U43_C07F23390 [Asparagus officinalis]|uniref:Uncharacterized protein n=1 Tax=Asparagus officinalis TaxID=4686 RepID=A0A5P1EHQ2_ASPOF|nr:uncharacterized protein LOC109849589 [Asparagus officinalis]ONK64221.1 uncharacterized protein A4U43_C07F23390 [Asparagus officinalis]
MNPTEVTRAAKTEDLSATGLHYSQDFLGMGSTCSGIESTSATEKKPEEEDLGLSTEKGAKGAVFSEEIARQGSFDPIYERPPTEESPNEQMLKQATEAGEELQIWLEKITNGDEVLSLQTWGMETVEVMPQGAECVVPEEVTRARGGKNVLEDVRTVTAGKRTEGPGTFTTRKKNVWSEEEHRLFLMGLKVHGRGAWKSIAKNFVHTRTPSQVASHAQKYFNRQLDERQKRRPSILDIKTINTTAKTRRESMYDSIKSSSQVNLNNAKRSSPSSMPLPPLPQMEFTQMASNEHPNPNTPKTNSQLPQPDSLEQQQYALTSGGGDHD